MDDQSKPLTLDAIPVRGPQPLFDRGFAPWRVGRLMAHMERNLDLALSVVTLAHVVSLSPSQFSRMFKSTFGCGPHVFLMRRRIERAQSLMLSSRASLAEIALRCGLADQAHLSRVFRKVTGESPASWRRARRIASPVATGRDDTGSFAVSL